jgi:hypoxanthine phosphoribosyltransferase
MAESQTDGAPVSLLSASEVSACVARMAKEIAPRISDETVAVCLLTGGIWFAADLTRALADEGRLVAFDALWIASYGDDHASRGRIDIRAPLQRPVTGKQVLIMDDVFDSGLSLREAVRILTEAGAAEVLTAVFARKPWPQPRGTQPDFIGWEAPARYLVGYGLDDGGRMRGLPGICALD